VHLLNTCLFFWEEVELFQTVRRKTLQSIFFYYEGKYRSKQTTQLCVKLGNLFMSTNFMTTHF